MTKFIILSFLSLNLYAKDSRPPVAPPAKESTSEAKVDLFERKTTFDQIFSDPAFVAKFEALSTALESQWPVVTMDLKKKIGKEFDRYNLSTVIGLKGNEVKILGSNVADIDLNIGKFQVVADLFYRIELRPSFKEGKQLRKDIYVVGLRGSHVIQAGSEVRITFFREFNSKMDAIMAGRPYGLREIPRNSEHIVTKLKVDDGVRMEAFANLQISDAVSRLTGSTNLSAILGYDLFQGLFALDVYKYSDTDVRARFMGTINRGTLKASVGLNWLSSRYRVGGILNKIFKDIFEVDFSVNVSKSFNFYNNFPIETHIADYFFRFDTPKSSQASIASVCNYQHLGMNTDDVQNNRALSAESAFDELISNVRSGQMISLFNPSLKEASLSAAILKNASKAETMACEDSTLPPYKRRVMHFFKGRMASDVFSLDMGPKISRLLQKKMTIGNSEIFVASLEKNQDFNYYLLMNNFSKFDNSYMFGRWENEYISDLDALYLSDKNKNVLSFLDFVKRVQYKDKNMSVSNLKEIRNNIDRSIPANFPDRREIMDLLPTTEQRDGLISLVYALSNDVVFQIEKMDKIVLYNKLYQFLDTHPLKYLMNLPPHAVGEGADLQGNFTQYVNNLFFKIVSFADSTAVPKERYLALKFLMGQKAFTEYIFNELFPSLISTEIASDAMSVQMSVSSDSLPLTSLQIGNNQYSGVYSAVLLLRSFLNDRSLDLRLESITTEDMVNSANPMKIKGFKIVE